MKVPTKAMDLQASVAMDLGIRVGVAQKTALRANFPFHRAKRRLSLSLSLLLFASWSAFKERTARTGVPLINYRMDKSRGKSQDPRVSRSSIDPGRGTWVALWA